MKIVINDSKEIEVKRVNETVTGSEKSLYIECADEIASDDISQYIDTLKTITVIREGEEYAVYEGYSDIKIVRLFDDKSDCVSINASKRVSA